MSMNHMNPDNEWEDDYYSRKHHSRTITAGYLVWLAGAFIIFALISMLFSCNRTIYPTQQPERIACDTLIDRATGERIPVYNCETW